MFPIADRLRQPAAFQDIRERRRARQAVLRVTPAQKRFGAGDAVVGEADKRLVVQFELALGHRFAQLVVAVRWASAAWRKLG